MKPLSKRLSAALMQHLEGGKPKAPEGSSILWNAFMALSRARTCGPMGPNPISYPEIAAWAQLMRMPLEPHHVEALAAMDAVWMKRAYRSDKSVPQGVKALPPRSEHALTPAMFDVFAG
ncbi:phage tail assembly chaperone [Salipiger profundus]|uniref:phage tail assembly chaperone n=1 Tax=Salipiger profundus TaxID=1229727 RepID=UPI0008E4041C|nr:hypothetical protein [Salipiger profundus]SFD16959.1 hypothetical protein SAMN05444415_10835 [Salipiger profundus]